MVPVKQSIAVMIFRGDQVLAVRRPDDDDELRGIWGLPAGTFRPGETLNDLIIRIGRDKLGVRLTAVRLLASGNQNRPTYRLEMELWEAVMEGTPNRGEWRFASLETLRPGMAVGSLCCELAIQNKSRDS